MKDRQELTKDGREMGWDVRLARTLRTIAKKTRSDAITQLSCIQSLRLHRLKLGPGAGPEGTSQVSSSADPPISSRLPPSPNPPSCSPPSPPNSRPRSSRTSASQTSTPSPSPHLRSTLSLSGCCTSTSSSPHSQASSASSARPSAIVRPQARLRPGPSALGGSVSRTLEIDTGDREPGRVLEGLPSSLTGPGVAPLRLDRLRLHHHGDVRHLLPLLKCLDPLAVGLCHDSKLGDRSFWTLSTLDRSWKNVRHMEYAGDYDFYQYRYDESLPVPSNPSAASTPFENVRTMTLLNLNRQFHAQPGPEEAEDDFKPWAVHAYLQRFCTQVEAIKILVADAESRRAVGKSLRLWTAAKPEGFYKIVVIQGRRDKWGDRVKCST